MEVSARSDQPRWLMGIDMDMGIKGSNNEPRAQIKIALLDAHSHDKDNGDITGTLRSPPRISDRLFVAAGAQHSQSPITAGGRAVIWGIWWPSAE